MIRFTATFLLIPVVGLSFATGIASAKPRGGKTPEAVALSADGEKFVARYQAMLDAAKAEVTAALPKVDPGLQTAIDQANAAAKQAQAAADAAQEKFGAIGKGRALVAHAKGKWIGGADQGIAKAKEALKNSKTEAERAAAQKALADWEKNREEGVAALKERQAQLDEALKNEAQLTRDKEAALASLKSAQDAETAASKKLLDAIAPVLAKDALDAVLARGAILTHATPQGLAAFAQQSAAHAAMVDKFLNDATLMKEMLEAGGASHGEWGNAIAIFNGIQKASPKAATGHFRRLAVGTSVAHARPIAQSKPKEPADAPAVNVDPVKRYLHFEKAFLAGELDPAFEHLTAWEYRHVVNCDSPDEVIQWGRTMLRNYRPDHIYNPDYGWRYVSSVRTEVPYGSQNVKYDDPKLYQYQNIIRNGGICGRRAFYGRFILRAFGIPTWGVTQRAHAAASHWTPKGWVTVLGAGYHASWWDKEDVRMSGSQFLMETQARAHCEEYIKVLRAQWISRILGEPAYNERDKVEGGFWSRAGLYQTRILASTAQELGPVGQELAEANDREQEVRSAAVTSADKEIRTENGVITIPAVATGKSSGKSAAMKSIDEGMQLHMLGGFKTEYSVEVPTAGTYQLVARVATVQTGQQFAISAGTASPTVIDVPYTLGMWEYTPPVAVQLQQGVNTLHIELKEGSRGVTVKDFMLKAAR
jgi:hypothetical protein